jgi:hypothetical protein
MTAQSISMTRTKTPAPTNWRMIRLGVGVLYLASEVGGRILLPHNRQFGALLITSMFVAVGIAATVLAFRSARSFDPGQTARRAWIFIAIMPLSDAITYIAYTMPAYLSNHYRSTAFIGAATLLLSITRILAAVAFVSMFRVYRKSGLRLGLRLRDYVAMGLITVMEVVSLLYANSGARASGGPDLAKLVLWTSIPLVIALVPCSVLGVMIWRYTTQMGGGLVAKAWQSTLLYGVAWLAYIAFHAVAAYYLRFADNKMVVSAAASLIIFTGVDWMLKGAEYLIFLGASFQYEACTTAPDFSEELSTLAAGA